MIFGAGGGARKASFAISEGSQGISRFGSILGSPMNPAGGKEAYQMGINPNYIMGFSSPVNNGFVPFGALSPADRLQLPMGSFAMPQEAQQPPSPPNGKNEEIVCESDENVKGVGGAGK